MVDVQRGDAVHERLELLAHASPVAAVEHGNEFRLPGEGVHVGDDGGGCAEEAQEAGHAVLVEHADFPAQ